MGLNRAAIDAMKTAKRLDTLDVIKTPGAKNDAGKLLYHLVDDGALEALVAVLTLGAAKYTEGGWRKVEDAFVRYDDALMRHRREFRRFLDDQKKNGKHASPALRKDNETQLPHTAQLLCNAMFLCALDLAMHDPGFEGTAAVHQAIEMWNARKGIEVSEVQGEMPKTYDDLVQSVANRVKLNLRGGISPDAIAKQFARNILQLTKSDNSILTRAAGKTRPKSRKAKAKKRTQKS